MVLQLDIYKSYSYYMYVPLYGLTKKVQLIIFTLKKLPLLLKISSKMNLSVLHRLEFSEAGGQENPLSLN